VDVSRRGAAVWRKPRRGDRLQTFESRSRLNAVARFGTGSPPNTDAGVLPGSASLPLPSFFCGVACDYGRIGAIGASGSRFRFPPPPPIFSSEEAPPVQRFRDLHPRPNRRHLRHWTRLRTTSTVDR
jgi:hypothetical protein